MARLVQVGQNIISYESYVPGGGGSLVGPGASPSSAPTLTPAAGSGIETGSHDYAATFVTAAGESIPGPRATISVGVVSAPATGPSAAAATMGAGPDNGDHRYVVTNVTASGETTPGPASNTITVNSPAAVTPPTAPTAATSSVTGNLVSTETSLLYETTFVTALGETIGGTPSGSVRIPAVTAPAGATMVLTGTTGGSLTASGSYRYWVVYVTATSTTGVAGSVTVGLSGGQNAVSVSSIPVSSDARVTKRYVYREVNGGGTVAYLVGTLNDNTSTTLTDTMSDGTLVSQPSITLSGDASTGYDTGQVSLTSVQVSGDARVTKRRIYRNSGGGYKLLTTINDNTTTTYTDNTATASLGSAIPSVNDAAGAAYHTIPVSSIPLGPASITTARKLYRQFNGAGNYKLVATISDNTTTTFSDTVTNASLGSDAPTSNTATANRVALSDLQLGGATVTGRKIYRTTAGGSTLKLLATIANNTTTTYSDSTADASLGASAPSVDTSGLTQPTGQILEGSTSLPLSSTAAFESTGGWAALANGKIVIRYSGLTATALTGIPASGPGSITSSVSYNSSVTACAMLTGIPASGDGSIAYDIAGGDPVNILARVDDPAGQARLAALIGGDGIVEDYQQDGRISYVEALSRATARLALRSQIELPISYTVRDPLTKSGRTIAVSLSGPTATQGRFLIRRVSISNFTAANYPDYTVEAVSTPESFDGLTWVVGVSRIGFDLIAG